MDLAGDPGGVPDSWLVAPADSLEWREWDGELVVYLDQRGSTHLLTPYAGAVFLTLLDGPPLVGLGELLSRLAMEEGLAPSPEPAAPREARAPEAQASAGADREQVLQVMAEFERIGLVRRH
jgi:hypothetical protein